MKKTKIYFKIGFKKPLEWWHNEINNGKTDKRFFDWCDEQGYVLCEVSTKPFIKESNPEQIKLLTDDCDLNQNRLEVFTGGNGDYYVAVVVDDISHAVRIAMSRDTANTRIKLAVANLYRAMNNIQNESNPEPTREELVEKAELFLVGRSLLEYLPEIMVDFHLEMKKNN